MDDLKMNPSLAPLMQFKDAKFFKALCEVNNIDIKNTYEGNWRIAKLPKETILSALTNESLQKTYEEEHKRESESLSEQLYLAAKSQNAIQCSELLKAGANANWLKVKGSNDWYEGNNDTALSACVINMDAGDLTAFIDTAKILLDAGADVHFKINSGNWNRSTSSPLVNELVKQVLQIPRREVQISIMKMFVERGAELIQRVCTGKQRSFHGWGRSTWSIFEIIDSVTKEGGDLDVCQLFLGSGVDVNCADSYWSIEEAEEADSDAVVALRHSYRTLLHAGIDTGNLELVKELVGRGADVNQGMLFTYSVQEDEDEDEEEEEEERAKLQFYVISSLELAEEIREPAIADVLREAGAKEVGESGDGEGEGEEAAQNYTEILKRLDSGKLIKWKDGGEGKWRELKERKRMKEERRKKKKGRKGKKGKKGKKGGGKKGKNEVV